MAGDWRLYLELLTKPDSKIAYQATPLNVHRRHLGSVTHSLSTEKHVAEIVACQKIVKIPNQKLATRIKMAQAAYIREIWAQFGTIGPLATVKKPRNRRVVDCPKN